MNNPNPQPTPHGVCSANFAQKSVSIVATLSCFVASSFWLLLESSSHTHTHRSIVANFDNNRLAQFATIDCCLSGMSINFDKYSGGQICWYWLLLD